MDTADFFCGPIRNHPKLEAAVRHEVRGVWRDMPPLHDTGCFISDLNSYLLVVASAFPSLAKRLMEGPHLDAYFDKQVKDADEQSDLSDLSVLQPLYEKKKYLRRLVSEITRALEVINDKKPQHRRPTKPTKSRLAVPEMKAKPSITASSLSFILEPVPPVQPPAAEKAASPPRRQAVELSTDDDDDDSRSSILSEAGNTTSKGTVMPQLAFRGTGDWTCPHKYKCELGGVARNGSLLVFERNSAFKAHLQKHTRPYKCDKPGCTNKKGFARIDQLRRHQETARHGRRRL